MDIGKPEEGETVVVSGAAGAVGSLVVQLAKISKCRVVAIAGSDQKCAWVKSLGADVALNYKASDFRSAMKSACPSGVDVYFENVGGSSAEAVFPLLNDFARVVACGMIAHYEADGGMAAGNPLALYSPQIVIKRIHIQGFICTDIIPKFPVIIGKLVGLVMKGKLKYKMDEVVGVENSIKALAGIFQGNNMGKRVIRMSEQPAVMPMRQFLMLKARPFVVGAFAAVTAGFLAKSRKK
ncbi:hypothetical protein CYMTET_42940 [Cymbomonas tetramitiformis]|uniref:Alcohol dehydrogenase-like C-terminal domain-containing protein n=1 Tax=Cymbomonas tetramitiformis TaxID=36881 RepID=A0AAE0F0S1_9CHLO|nr:hypothetical protein CYMTET_42940 [Cymbomonas tetramitiformis]